MERREKNRKKLPYHLCVNPFKNLHVVDDLGAQCNLPRLIQKMTEDMLIRPTAKKNAEHDLKEWVNRL